MKIKKTNKQINPTIINEVLSYVYVPLVCEIPRMSVAWFFV